jgi:hypothetical protein
MILLYPLVSEIGVKRDRIAYVFPNRIFIHLEIMFAAFGFLYVNDFPAVPLNDYLGLQRVALFFPE